MSNEIKNSEAGTCLSTIRSNEIPSILGKTIFVAQVFIDFLPQNSAKKILLTRAPNSRSTK